MILGLGLGAASLIAAAFTVYARTMAEAANVASINVPFPGSIAFYTGGAIVVEALYRLIPITLLVWLISSVLLRKRGRATVFWVVAPLVSLLEPAGQMSIVAGHPVLMAALGAAMYALNIIEAFLLWRYGFLAPLAFRVAFYLVWHGAGSAIGL